MRADKLKTRTGITDVDADGMEVYGTAIMEVEIAVKMKEDDADLSYRLLTQQIMSDLYCY